MSYETEVWPFIQARDFGPKRTGTVRLLVIHDMEFPERVTAAEDVARYFQHPDTPSSCHVCVDSDSVIQCVKDSYVAFAAPGANADGIQIELAGYGNQTPGEWRDKYSIAMLAIAADVLAQYALKYNIPLIHLSNDELRAGKKGVVGHYQVSEVYRKSDHTDPGQNFPWPRFLLTAQAMLSERK
jgi:N-acetyl-anhydromuramyl-L-alanine amidase AmpD